MAFTAAAASTGLCLMHQREMSWTFSTPAPLMKPKGSNQLLVPPEFLGSAPDFAVPQHRGSRAEPCRTPAPSEAEEHPCRAAGELAAPTASHLLQRARRNREGAAFLLLLLPPLRQAGAVPRAGSAQQPCLQSQGFGPRPRAPPRRGNAAIHQSDAVADTRRRFCQ